MGTWVRPVNAPITQGFNAGATPGQLNGHPGTDYGAPCGTAIGAASSGVVTYAGPASGFGLAISIYHPDEDVTTTYGHMYVLGVGTGQNVYAGQFIAPVGSNGQSTGCHLHAEIRRGRALFGATYQNMDFEAWLQAHIGHAVKDTGNNRFVHEPTIRLGNTGQAVKDLQYSFNVLGFKTSVDGAFGQATLALVKNFQAFFHMTADGIVGPQTWAVLATVLSSKGK